LESSYLLTQMSWTCRPPGKIIIISSSWVTGPAARCPNFGLRLAVTGLQLKLFNNAQLKASKIYISILCFLSLSVSVFLLSRDSTNVFC
jgi:hypothetical protein